MSKFSIRSCMTAAVLTLGIAGCADSENEAPTDNAPTTSSPNLTEEHGETTDGDPGEGSQPESPEPAGTPAVVETETGTWEITLHEPDTVIAEQQAAEGWVELDSGEVLLIVPVEATYSGDGNAQVGSDVAFYYVTASGESVSADPLGPLGADPLMDADPVFDDGTAQGNLMFVVSESNDPGVWWVTDATHQTDGTFIEGPPATS